MHLVSLCAFTIGSSLAMSFRWSNSGLLEPVVVVAVCTAVWAGTWLITASAPMLRWLGRVCWTALLTGWMVWLYLALTSGIFLSTRGPIGATLVGTLCIGVWMGTGLTAAASTWRCWAGRVCWVVLLACYGLWVYLAVTFGVLLGWTVPNWLLASIALTAVAVVATLRRPRDRPYIPLVLPLGMWIAAVLSGWLREENLLRCDDFLALRAPVQLVVPSNPRLGSCQPGEVRPSGRFPRTIWEAPDGKRVIFSTQGAAAPGGIDGSVCEARLDGNPLPHCVGPPISKSQGLIDLPEQGRLLAMQWGVQTPAGTPGGVVFELPRSEGIAILAQHWFDELVGDGFYEPRNSTLYMFSDRINGIHRAVLPTFESAPTIPIEFAPGELHYDRTTGEGVACGHGIGVAIRGAPFTARYFSHESRSPIDKISMTWGCDWDETARKVYSTIPNLGLLDRIDYDTGYVEHRWFVGPGMRSVAYDRARRRVYFTNFLRGDVIALDEASGRIVSRWFVGRFSRWVQLTHDGRALLATGNLGIVRIPLDG